LQIDLNSDLGESFGPWTMGQDEELMEAVTSANIACGFHAGDPTVLRRTIALAKAKGVAVGAHPGFPDLAGFGRREMQLTPSEVEDSVLYQVAAIAGVAATEGVRLQHVKAHGALYNMAARDVALARAIARAVAAFDRSLILFGLPNSALLSEGERAGLAVAAEIFADRTYEADGSLTSRRVPGSVIHDPELVVDRAVQMALRRKVTTTSGSEIELRADTMCLHGDTKGSADLARRIRSALQTSGIRVAAIRATTP
jgi:UPF0271 protein